MTGSKPTVSGFAAAPTTLYSGGGTIFLSASVTNAVSCTFSSKEPVSGLPATVPCTSGTVVQHVTLPANPHEKKEKTYIFRLTVSGAKTVKSGEVRVKVGDSPSPFLTGVRSVSSGGFGACALVSMGGVDCWGWNQDGELGNGGTGGSDGQSGDDTPQEAVVINTEGRPEALTNAVSIIPEGLDACAVLSTGGADCWGYNYYGSLGNGTTGGPDGEDGWDTPQVVTGITNAISLAGDCAVLSTGGVDCWGVNFFGQVGNGTTSGPDGAYGYDAPQAVVGITDAVSITLDGNTYCAVLSTGGVECWGYNGDGELGNGTTVDSDVPVAVTGITNATSVISDDSGNGVCALLSTGGVDCWGDNTNGELGNGMTGGPDGDSGYDTPQVVTGLTNAVSLVGNSNDTGGDESYCAVLSTGGVECWGYNGDGELGNGTTSGSDGESGYDTPEAATGITDAISVTSDVAESYCAVLLTGGTDCWGDNELGELGNGTTSGPDGEGGYDTPQEVAGLADAISVTGETGWEAYCAVLSTGGADCWGNTSYGALGNGTINGPDGSAGQGGYDTPQPVDPG